MELEDEMFIEDDADILDIIQFGFPRQLYIRSDYFTSLDELTFFKRFRLTKNTTLLVLQEIEDDLEFNNDLNNSVIPMNQLLTALRFYATGGHQSTISDFIGMHQATASRIIYKVSCSLARLMQRYISMPENTEIAIVQNGFYRMARFPRIIGCIDGTHVKIQSPGGEDAEIYRNRKSYFSLNVQVVCDSQLKIRDIVARWPGSAHDLTIFNNSRLRARFVGGIFPNCILLGDSGYISRHYFMTPIPNPVTRGAQLYNESLIRTRNTVERQIGVWKRRFPCLAYGFRCRMATILPAIVATAVLHNIAITMGEEPPPLDAINIQELQNLIAQGDVADVPNVANPGNNDYREQLIQDYFENL